MTTLGLQWLQHQETKRSNLAKEQNTIYQVDTQARTADKDRSSRESIASLDRVSREQVATADRTSRENIASLDRLSKEKLAANQLEHEAAQKYYDRENQYMINQEKLESQESIADKDRLSKESIANLDRDSREYLNQVDNTVKYAIAQMQDARNAESNAVKLQSELYKMAGRMVASSNMTTQKYGFRLMEDAGLITYDGWDNAGVGLEWWLKNVWPNSVFNMTGKAKNFSFSIK